MRKSHGGIIALNAAPNVTSFVFINLGSKTLNDGGINHLQDGKTCSPRYLFMGILRPVDRKVGLS